MKDSESNSLAMAQYYLTRQGYFLPVTRTRLRAADKKLVGFHSTQDGFSFTGSYLLAMGETTETVAITTITLTLCCAFEFDLPIHTPPYRHGSSLSHLLPPSQSPSDTLDIICCFLHA